MAIASGETVNHVNVMKPRGTGRARGNAVKATKDDNAEIRSILNSMRRIVDILRVASRAAEKDVGLSGAQLWVLHKLAEGPVISLNELAERTCTHQTSVSVVVYGL